MNESLLTIKFDDYIELLDRILENRGFKENEREIIFNDNANLISIEFKKRTHPSVLSKILNVDSIIDMYHKNNDEDIYNEIDIEDEEEKYVPDIYFESLLIEKNQNSKKSPVKFKKVMKEFGKGELKPYHSDSSLKSKKQNGSKKDHKQALAIAFSEAGMKNKTKAKSVKESINNILSPKSREDIMNKLQNENLSQEEKDEKLIIASIGGNPGIVKMLIELGADVNAKSRTGTTALMYASIKNYLEVVKLLIEFGANVNIVNNVGETALLWALIASNKNIVDLLKKHGAK